MRIASMAVVGLFLACTAAQAAVFRFDTDPFAGTTALTTPGRQIVGAPGTEIAFTAADVIEFDSSVFDVNTISFANGLAASLPTTGVNFIVLQDTGTPFAAGIAANLIAARVTSPGAGFFIYFNTNLDVARLVYSTDLNDQDADLAILARLTSFSGSAGFAALPTLTAANFAVAQVPEPSTVLLIAIGAVLIGARRHRARRE